jgi:D-sedoheptulose 7-phosphate isomerase
MNKKVEQPIAVTADAAAYARGYAARVTALLDHLDYAAVGRLADLLLEARDAGRTIFLAGNGGSAAAASHWAVDLMHGTYSQGTRPLRAISLADNVSALTAIANDRAYEDVFAAQLEKLLQPRDVVVVISASGSSPNVVRAVEHANAHGATTVGVLGFDGGRLRELCHLVVMVATAPGEYGPVEDIHLVVNHILTTWLKARVAAPPE